VAGAGELSLIALPIVVLGILGLVVCWNDPLTRFFLPWFIVAILYPAPDILTTDASRPPYTLAVFGSALCLPFIAGQALRGLQTYGRRSAPVSSSNDDSPKTSISRRSLPTVPGSQLLNLFAVVALVAILISGWRFYAGPYQDYPNISTDYWGWQYGPKQMISYYKQHADQYDEFIFDGNFNEAFVFLDFYLQDTEMRNRASIGDLSRLDFSKHQLFAIKAETWNRLPGSQVPSKSYLVIDSVITFPNGKDAAYLVELRPPTPTDESAEVTKILP
jgi:hypothetical protein